LRKTRVEALPTLMTAGAQAYPGSFPELGAGRIDLAQVPVPEGVPDNACPERRNGRVLSGDC